MILVTGEQIPDSPGNNIKYTIVIRSVWKTKIAGFADIVTKINGLYSKIAGFADTVTIFIDF